jgi:hypothetical protein
LMFSVQLMDEWVMDTINIIGAVASIIGLLITCFVLWRVGRIERRFSAQGLLPGYLKTLGGAVRNLEEHQRSKNGPKIRSVLSTTRATLKDMARCLDKGRAADVQRVVVSITKRLNSSDDVLWEESGSALADLQEVQETVKNYLKAMPWRGPNA